jgi:hypothetical protein
MTADNVTELVTRPEREKRELALKRRELTIRFIIGGAGLAFVALGMFIRMKVGTWF